MINVYPLYVLSETTLRRCACAPSHLSVGNTILIHFFCCISFINRNILADNKYIVLKHNEMNRPFFEDFEPNCTSRITDVFFWKEDPYSYRRRTGNRRN